MSALRFRYQTIEFGDVDIHLRTLRDRQQFEDIDGIAAKLGIPDAFWALFGVVWESSEVLAHLMQDYDIAGRRVLEVGCGIGLASLMLNQRQADITATDYHPSVQDFLEINAKLNHGADIPFVRTAWSDDATDLGEFDLIIGSDLLYERNNAEALAGFINQHACETCEVILIDPGRGQSGRFSGEMESLGYSYTHRKPEHTDYLRKPYKGVIHRYLRH
jgi:predicted nicotinamide N-methyase